MKKLSVCLAGLVLLLGSLQATAAEQPKEFAVLPFQVHGPQEFAYLEHGLQSMLVSRLTWVGRYDSVDVPAGDVPQGTVTRQAAQGLMERLGLDYLVWGDATIMGQQASVDIRVLDRNATMFTESYQSALDDLIPGLEDVAQSINTEVFERQPRQAQARSQGQAASAGQQPAQPRGKLNQALVYERRQQPAQQGQGGGLNPEFRYQRQDTTRGSGPWRSQSFGFAAHGMVLGDADGDGAQEIFIMEDHAIRAFRARRNRLEPLDTYDLNVRRQCLNINYLDTDQDGFGEIIVSAYKDDPDDPDSFMLTFRDGRFQVKEQGIDYFLGVARIPPEFSPRLIGQKKGRGNDLFSQGVYEMVKTSGSYELGPRLPLPNPATVFNFAYLPQPRGQYKVVMVNGDNLFIYSHTGEVLDKTGGIFAAKDLGLEFDDRLPGMGKAESNRHTYKYYIPTRIVPTDLESSERSEFLVSRSYAPPATFLRNYRAFEESEIQSFYWGNRRLQQHWRTEKIEGNLADYGVGDMNNDGHPELYACVVSNPGASGLRNRKTYVMGYRLDLSEGGEKQQEAKED